MASAASLSGFLDVTGALTCSGVLLSALVHAKGQCHKAKANTSSTLETGLIFSA